jgi:molybdenum cofactor cytidylyltransferase
MIVGVLLAAGEATRFGSDKLLVELGHGQCVAEVACASLRPAVDRLIAIVRPGASELAHRLALAGAEICVFAKAAEGMGASLAHGVALTPQSEGWLIALADMPLVAPDAALRIAEALRAGAAIAVPVARGRRGHPVGFAQCYFDELTGLGDDRGARTILAKNANRIVEIPVDDASAWHDVDTVDDLGTARQLFNRNFP